MKKPRLVVSVLAVLAVSGGVGAWLTAGSVANSAAGGDAAETEYVGDATPTEREAAALADGIVTDEEYADAVSATHKCVADIAGVTVDEVERRQDGSLGFTFSYGPDIADAVNEAYTQCYDSNLDNVEAEYMRSLTPSSIGPVANDHEQQRQQAESDAQARQERRAQGS